MISIPNLTRDELTAVLQRCPSHYRPIVEAIRDHGCGYAMVLQDAGPFTLPLHVKPAIVVLGDDLYTSRGPEAFDTASLESLIRKCKAAFVIASAAEPETYAKACAGPVVSRQHVVIIETLPAHEEAWVEAVLGFNPDIRMIVSRADPLARPAPQTFGRA